MDQAAGQAWSRLQALPDRAPDERRLRDPGDAPQRADRRHSRQRHASPGNLYRPLSGLAA